MPDLTLQLADWLAKELANTSKEFVVEVLELGLRTWKIQRALIVYAHGKMTLGAAAQLAGVTESEMARQAYARGLGPRYSTDTLNEELIFNHPPDT
jgi:predicted HTH domain antitoxin